MAKEYKRIENPPLAYGKLPDELERLLDEGWYVKRFSYNHITHIYEFEMEREVPDHENQN